MGEALTAQVLFDPGGQLLTGSLMDYALPKAETMPTLFLDHTETPSPLNPLGARVSVKPVRMAARRRSSTLSLTRCTLLGSPTSTSHTPRLSSGPLSRTPRQDGCCCSCEESLACKASSNWGSADRLANGLPSQRMTRVRARIAENGLARAQPLSTTRPLPGPGPLWSSQPTCLSICRKARNAPDLRLRCPSCG